MTKVPKCPKCNNRSIQTSFNANNRTTIRECEDCGYMKTEYEDDDTNDDNTNEDED